MLLNTINEWMVSFVLDMSAVHADDYLAQKNMAVIYKQKALELAEDPSIEYTYVDLNTIISHGHWIKPYILDTDGESIEYGGVWSDDNIEVIVDDGVLCDNNKWSKPCVVDLGEDDTMGEKWIQPK